MIEINSRFETVEGLRIHYLEAGPSDGVPVLLLHGWPTNGHLWRGVMDPLAASGRRAIALDLPGFGDSDKPSDASYSFPFFTRVIDGLLARLAIDRIGLAVHDLGGPIGLYWAAKNPRRVVDLALLNTLVFPEILLGSQGVRGGNQAAWRLAHVVESGGDSVRHAARYGREAVDGL